MAWLTHLNAFGRTHYTAQVWQRELEIITKHIKSPHAESSRSKAAAAQRIKKRIQLCTGEINAAVCVVLQFAGCLMPDRAAAAATEALI
jgi:hypothetical protein